MNDLHQIEVIANALKKEKEKFTRELMKINHSIVNKKALIDKMITYQSDYLNNCNLQLSKSIPGLHLNINLFVKKIGLVISQAEIEIQTMQSVKSSIMESLTKINKKIDLMQVFENKSKQQLVKREEKREQNALDDITSTMQKRREYD